MMLRVIPPVLGILMFLFAVSHVAKRVAGSPEGRAEPPGPVPERPAGDVIAATGVVEPSTETIQVGTAVGGIVREVAARVGDRLREGSVLVNLKAAELEAEVRVREAALAAQLATLSRLKSLPRTEEVPALEAKVAEARALALDQKEQLERNSLLSSRGALGTEELRRKELGHQAALARQKAAEADLRLLMAGAWASDLALQEARVEEARSQLGAIRADLDRRTIRVPAVRLREREQPEELTVLQVNIRPGEMARADSPLVLLGGLSPLHVRVDVDENDVPRFRAGAGGEARTRGTPVVRHPLVFVRVEPRIVPRLSLSGAATERVDSRVLQVVFALPAAASGLYVGQQVDVFLER